VGVEKERKKQFQIFQQNIVYLIRTMTEQNENTTESIESFEDLENDLKSNYNNPGHPIAFSGINNVYDYYQAKLSKTKIKDILAGIENYTLHREYHKSQRNPSYSHFKRNQFQMDLVDIQELAPYNDNVRYILTVIDTFTRYAWARLLKDKRGETVLDAFKSILAVACEPPRNISCDRGTEFNNQLFQKFCESNNITFYTPDSSIHGAYIERFNRTLQSLVYKYMTENETHRFIDKINPDGKLSHVFVQLMNTYNNRKHRMIGTTPSIAENYPEVHLDMRLKMSKYYETIKKKKRNFNVGDTVRIAKQKGKFSRGYKEQSQQEIYKIYEVKQNTKIPMYLLETYDASEKIKGAFYDFELTKVNSETFRIEKVLQTRKRGNQVEHFVKWKGFNDSYNSWVQADNVTQKF
jgi:transposase InsO family protein